MAASNRAFSSTFRLSDELPDVCVACGVAATGMSMRRVKLPRDDFKKRLNFVQFLALFFGFIVFWYRENSPRTDVWVQLPHCDHLGSSSEEMRDVTVKATDQYRGRIEGVCWEFCKEMGSSESSASSFAAMDAGPGEDPDEFFGKIDKSTVHNPGDFLKDLGSE